jgi:hypothetical protein
VTGNDTKVSVGQRVLLTIATPRSIVAMRRVLAGLALKQQRKYFCLGFFQGALLKDP